MEDGRGKLKANQNVDLPAEIIDEILSRLPVKPLCRFRCVSKPWQSRISDPNFIAMHSSKAIDNKDVFFQRVKLVFTGLATGRFYALDLNQLLNHNVEVDGFTATFTELDFVSPNRNTFSLCNSFLYLQGSSSFDLITNPATRETKKVPKPPVLRQWPSFELNSASGFGFDHSTNQYKLVNAEYTEGHRIIDNRKGHGLAFRVYTLEASSSWRQVEGVYPYCISRTAGILLNGCVHWLGLRDGRQFGGQFLIVSFGLAKEEVKEIAPPPGHYYTNIDQLGVFRNQLCVTVTYSAVPIEYNEFWVMKKYGVRDSWTKMLVSKPYKELLHSGFSTESHDLMVFDRSSLIMYNFNDGTFWNLNIGEVGTFEGFGDVGVYVESLASLADEEEEQE